MPLNNEDIVVPDDFKTALDAVLKKALDKKGNEEYYDPQEPLVQDLIKILRDEADALGAGEDDASVAQEQVVKQLQGLLAVPVEDESSLFIYKSQALVGQGKPGNQQLLNSEALDTEAVPRYLGLCCDASLPLKRVFGQEVYKLITDSWDLLKKVAPMK